MAQLIIKNRAINLTVLLLSILVIFSAVESRNLGKGFANPNAVLVCNSVYGAESEDTCSSVAQNFDLSLDSFININPNINCDKIFVGQWLCVDGSFRK